MRRILILDDNPLVARIWASQLESDGFAVSVVEDQVRFFEAIGREKPMLVLIDSAIPQGDGLAVCERIGAQKAAFGHPKVVLLTNVDSPEIHRRVAAGAAAAVWLKHDLNPRELALRIRRLLQTTQVSTLLHADSTIGDALVHAGYLRKEDLAKAHRVCAEDGLELPEALLRLNLLSPADVRRLHELVYRADYVDLSLYAIDAAAVARVPEDLALRFQVLPLRLTDGELELVMADPRDVVTLDHLRERIGCPIRPFFAPLPEIQKAQMLQYGAREVLDPPRPAAVVVDERSLIGNRSIEELLADHPVVETLDVVLLHAREAGASDVHIEPMEKDALVRLRIDGKLQVAYRLLPEHSKALTSRVKIVSNLDIVECRRPQDGRFQMQFGAGSVDYRVSTMPMMDGEKVVIRILDRRMGITALEDLGFEPDQLERYTRMARRPYGMMLVTGPTGCGKSTTLFATLHLIRDPQRNIVSIEDPVEARIPGINQIQVNPRIQLTFAGILRNVLRQDPNTILVGEIRDLETAQLAAQAALTGHLVLSTLHTNDAPTAVLRLVDMGIPRYMVTATVHGIVAQRLLRRLCTACRTVNDPAADPGRPSLPPELAGTTVYRPQGCPRCRGSGYRGRVAIYEVMPLNRPIRRCVLQGGDADTLAGVAAAEGVRTLREAAMRKVREGTTSLEEVWSMTLETEFESSAAGHDRTPGAPTPDPTV